MHEAPVKSWEKLYLAVFGGLVVFTIVTYLFAENLFHGNLFATVVAVMLIAVCKASLVAMFFMHLKFEGRWKYVLLVPACALAVILVFALLPDIAGLGRYRA